MRERRQLTRHVVRKSAKVLLGDQPSPIDCLVWDLTSKGACILLAPDLHVPDKFEISFDYFAQAIRAASCGKRPIGLEFAFLRPHCELAANWGSDANPMMKPCG